MPRAGIKLAASFLPGTPLCTQLSRRNPWNTAPSMAGPRPGSRRCAASFLNPSSTPSAIYRATAARFLNSASCTASRLFTIFVCGRTAIVVAAGRYRTVSDELDDDGLTAREREFLTTPMSSLNPEQRLAAMSIRDKRDNARWAANAEHRAKKEAERKAAAV